MTRIKLSLTILWVALFLLSPVFANGELILDGKKYTIVDGLIEDGGGWDALGIEEQTHRYFYVELSDSKFNPVANSYASENSTLNMGLSLYSHGVNTFGNESFYYIQFDQIRNREAMRTESFFDESSTDVGIGDYYSLSKTWGVEKGTVTVKLNGGANYTFEVDVIIKQYDQFEHFIDGTEQELKFSFTGDFKYVQTFR